MSFASICLLSVSLISAASATLTSNLVKRTLRAPSTLNRGMALFNRGSFNSNFTFAMKTAHESYLKAGSDSISEVHKSDAKMIIEEAKCHPLYSEIFNFIAHFPSEYGPLSEEFLTQFKKSNDVKAAFKIDTDAVNTSFLSVRDGLVSMRNGVRQLT